MAMSRDVYGPGSSLGSGMGTRSPRSAMRISELPTVDRSPSRNYPGATANRHSPSRRRIRGGTGSPDHYGSYYARDEDLSSPVIAEDRGRPISSGGSMHRSRSATRAMPPSERGGLTTRYQSLDRGGGGGGILSDHDREFVPIREPRDRSLDRSMRDRAIDRNMFIDDDEMYVSGVHGRSMRQSPTSHLYGSSGHHLRDTAPSSGYLGELQHQNTDLHKELTQLKRELELTNQKLGSSMHSIKTFWSPELKKERALRKEESAKYSLINDQLKMLHAENQVAI